MMNLIVLTSFLFTAPHNAIAADWTAGSQDIIHTIAEVRSRLIAPVVVGRDAGGMLILKGEDCAIIEIQVKALARWKLRLNEPAPETVTCRCSAADCQAGISSVTPAFINLTHGTRARRWGPNCWNTVLVASKILEASSFTSPEEMSYWMKSPLCRVLRAGETPQPGDIIAIRDQAEQELHAFINLTEGLSFSKNNFMAAAPFALQNPEAVYREYPVPAGCRQPGHPASCPIHTDFFRCITAEDYRPLSGPPPTAEYAQAEAKVFEVERAVDHLVFHWESDPAFRSRAEVVLAASRKSLIPLRALARSRTGLVWTALALRIDAILHQIELI